MTEIQPQPRPTDPGGLRILRAHEAPKDARLLVHRNADPSVLDADFSRVISAICSHSHYDGPTLRTVFDRIGKQVVLLEI